MKLALGYMLLAPSTLLMGQSAQYAQPAAVERFHQILKGSQGGLLVILDDGNGSLHADFRKLMQGESLAELRLRLWTVRDGGESEIASYLKSRLSWDKGPRWAFIDAGERCLAQGAALPDGQALADQLAMAGIEGPVKRLRAFVRQNPENLDGKLALMNTLRSIADERTRGAIGDQINQINVGGDGGPRPFGGPRRAWRMAEMVGAVGAGEKPIQLPQEDDLKIWARWADEFDRLMASGQWLESDFSFNYSSDFLERHSTIVREMYKRRIGLVEEALYRWPGSSRIWGIWLHMFLVLGDRSAKGLVNSLAPMPDSVPGTWPPYEAKMVLIQEARRTGYWRDMRDMLWDSWLHISGAWRRLGSIGFDDPGGRRFMPQVLEAQWQQLFEPLIESLLMTGDIAGAETVVGKLRELADWGELSDLAAAVAVRCEMPQVAARWRN